MMNFPRRKSLALIAATGSLLQITACFGSDPQFFFVSSFTNAIIASVVNALVGAVLTATA